MMFSNQSCVLQWEIERPKNMAIFVTKVGNNFHFPGRI